MERPEPAPAQSQKDRTPQLWRWRRRFAPVLVVGILLAFAPLGPTGPHRAAASPRAALQTVIAASSVGGPGAGLPPRPDHPRLTPRPRAEAETSSQDSETPETAATFSTAPPSAVPAPCASATATPARATLTFSSKASRTRGQPVSA